jgi:hypothetical protein
MTKWLSSFDGRFQGSKKMSGFPMLSRYFASHTRIRASRSFIAIAAVAAFGLADAAPAQAGLYDGTWTTVFATTRGNCSSGYSVPFLVSGSRVSSAGGGRVSGSVGRGGSVAVAVSVGASHASGGGRLAGNRGAGRWSGIITGDRCSGTWQATRS